jgi:hypothetical protein
MKRKSKRAQRTERAFLIWHAMHLTKVINKLEPHPCESECKDHLMWSCEAEANHYDGTTHHIVMAGAIYPDGGWTAHIVEHEDPDYQERMAFVPPMHTLVWEFNEDRETIVLELEEVVALMVGNIPNN